MRKDNIMKEEEVPPFLQLVASDCPVYHSLLVVGVRRTPDDDMGGIAFLVQDSNAKRPFAVVGLDLLRSMGVCRFLYVMNGLSFWTKEEDHFEASSSIFITSPWPDVLNTTSDFQQNPGKYLHKIDRSKSHTFFS